MTDKKMTQKAALEYVVNILADSIANEEPELTGTMQEVHDVLKAMLEKKSETKPRKIDEQTLAFRAALTEILKDSEGPLTNKELQEELQAMVDAGGLVLAPAADGSETKKVSPQRVANNIKVLEKVGIITRIRGEKASDKDSFTIA